MTSQTPSLAHSAYSCGTTRRRSQPAGKRGSLAATAVAAVAVGVAIVSVALAA